MLWKEFKKRDVYFEENERDIWDLQENQMPSQIIMLADLHSIFCTRYPFILLFCVVRWSDIGRAQDYWAQRLQTPLLFRENSLVNIPKTLFRELIVGSFSKGTLEAKICYNNQLHETVWDILRYWKNNEWLLL